MLFVLVADLGIIHVVLAWQECKGFVVMGILSRL